MKLKELLSKGLKDSAYYLLGDTGTKVIRVLALPVITSLLSVEQFGEYDFLLLISAMIELTIGAGLDSGFAVLVAEKRNTQRDLNAMFTMSLVFVAFLGLVVGSIALLVNNWFDWFNSSTFILLILFTVTTSISRLVFNFLRWNEKAKKAAIANFFGSVAGIAGGLSLIYWVEATMFLLILGLFVGALLALIINLLLVRNYIRIPSNSVDFQGFKSYLGHSIPFVPSYLMNYFLKSSDRWLIMSFIGLEALGYYGVITRIAQLVLFGVNLFGKGFLPVMFKNYETVSGREFIRKVYDSFNLFLVPVVGLAFLISPIVLRLFAAEYQDLANMLTVLIGVNLVTGGVSLSGFGFAIRKRTYWIPIITGISILLNVLISYLLISDFGIGGVIFGTLIASIITAISRIMLSEKLYKFDYSLKYMISSCVLLIVFSAYLVL